MFHIPNPVSVLISGPSNSGKTFFVSKFIKNRDRLMSPPPERITWCYSIWQKVYDEIEAEFIQGVPDFDYFDGRQTNLVLDDLMDQKVDLVTKYFTLGSHHLNLTVFYLVQNLFFRGIRTISLNSQIVVLFKNPRDSQQVSFFARQSYARHIKEIETIFADYKTPTRISSIRFPL